MAKNPKKKSKKTDYKIGYKKPPKEHQFKPGQSGNPKGRPKKNHKSQRGSSSFVEF